MTLGQVCWRFFFYIRLKYISQHLTFVIAIFSLWLRGSRRFGLALFGVVEHTALQVP